MTSVTIPPQTSCNETLSFNETSFEIFIEKLPHEITLSLTEQKEKVAHAWQLTVNNFPLWHENKPFAFHASEIILSECFGHIILKTRDKESLQEVFVISPKIYSFCGFRIKFGFVVKRDNCMLIVPSGNLL